METQTLTHYQRGSESIDGLNSNFTGERKCRAVGERGSAEGTAATAAPSVLPRGSSFRWPAPQWGAGQLLAGKVAVQAIDAF